MKDVAGRQSKNPSSAADGGQKTEKPADRRRSPRIEILGRLHGQIVSLDVPVTVRDISLHGLSIETPFAFPDGVVHEFRLMLGDGSSALLRGRIVHSRKVVTGGSETFVSGVEFVDDQAREGETTVSDIIDHMTEE